VAAAVEATVVFLPGNRCISYYNAGMALELRFLGDLQVIRDGERLELPPSKKTRALLAYLVLTRRPQRREHLSELFWEIPDDPRGSLRWSLSKLRRLVDEPPGRERIRADRLTVSFDASDVEVDVFALEDIARGDLERHPIAELESAAERYCGANPLEGLELPAFGDFDAWCTATRESITRAQLALLRAVIRRTGDDAERALPHAHTLVRISPYDEAARAMLIRLLLRLGRHDQARQQYQIGERMLKEAGVASNGELRRALSAPPPASPPAPQVAPAVPKVVQDRSAPAAADAPPLVGRDAELERILSALSQSMERRRATLVLLCGEPGIGKSRLLEAVTARFEKHALLLQACAYESESIRPFALWVDALRRVGPEVASAVFGSGDHANRERLFAGLSDLIGERVRAQPVLLAFDDLQWGDESSAAALHYVMRTHADQPLLGILAARDDELRDNAPFARAVRELRQAGLLIEQPLGPMPQRALREIISTRAPQADSERLSRECGGNPLLAIELARAEAAGDSGHSLSELVQERLARFDLEGGEVLRWAAVLAPRIDANTLARVTGLDWNRIGEVLDSAARQAMLVPVEQGFRFSHDLIARSIYAGIPAARRRTMHRRAAEVLEQDTALDPERAADLAHHAAQSGDAGLAARAMVCAGRFCLRFFANEEARNLARRGLQWVQQLPPAQRVCLTLDLQEILFRAAPVEDWEGAAREFAALAEQALDHGALSHARRGYFLSSYLRWMHGHWSGARDEILQAERVARGAGDEDHIIGMAEAARCLAMLERDLTHADAMLMEAQALAARKRVSHCAIPAAVGMLQFHQGHLDNAVERFEEARMLARSAGDRLSEFQAIEYLAMIDIERGRPEAARTRCAALIELGDKLREGSERPFAHALDALCRYQIEDDAQPLESALVGLRAADAKHRLAYILTRAALVDLDRGRPQAAMTRAREALAYAEALQRPSDMALAHVALARALRAANDPDGFAKHAAALESLDHAPVARWARDRVKALRSTPE
jgi:DNA-binding SARP family transcriptional activator/tetratricopeptide (TPR) repeat protein